MKIVFFDFVTRFGGGPQLAADIAKRLSVHHNVEVIDAYGVCEQYIRTLKDAGIKVHVIAPKVKDVYIGYQKKRLLRLWRMICQIPIFLRLRSRLIKTIGEINPDVIWTNSLNGLMFLGMNFRLLRYPLAREYIGCCNAASIPKCDRWLMKYRANVVMAISTETARQLQLAGVPERKIKIVFDTIDIADTLRRSKQPFEVSLPGLVKHPRILVPANLVWKKGQYTAIKAIARLKSEGFVSTLWVAGNAVGKDQSYPEYLQNLAKELGVSENTHFFGWRDDVPAIMSQADIVVLPTHEEGFGHVILEAMVLKKPVIATPVGGIKDSIQNGENGLVFPVDDDEALAGCIRRLADDRGLVDKLIGNGYKTITETFNPENHTKRFLEGLKHAIQSRIGTQ